MAFSQTEPEYYRVTALVRLPISNTLKIVVWSLADKRNKTDLEKLTCLWLPYYIIKGKITICNHNQQ